MSETPPTTTTPSPQPGRYEQPAVAPILGAGREHAELSPAVPSAAHQARTTLPCGHPAACASEGACGWCAEAAALRLDRNEVWRERDEARAWGESLARSAREVTCVWCGHQFESTLQSQAEQLYEHAKVCEKHPVRRAELERDLARAALRRFLDGEQVFGHHSACRKALDTRLACDCDHDEIIAQGRAALIDEHASATDPTRGMVTVPAAALLEERRICAVCGCNLMLMVDHYYTCSLPADARRRVSAAARFF